MKDNSYVRTGEPVRSQAFLLEGDIEHIKEVHRELYGSDRFYSSFMPENVYLHVHY